MGAAFGWGLLAASSLVIGAIVALLVPIRLPTIGLIMGFGAGVLISAVAFDLVQEAVELEAASWAPALGIFAGCGLFFGGDVLIDRMGGGDRKDARGAQESGSPLAIVLGTVAILAARTYGRSTLGERRGGRATRRGGTWAAGTERVDG